jgi:hypothetical protein
MERIETKYFGYSKLGVYWARRTRPGSAQTKDNTMNTNKVINLIPAGVVLGGLTFLALVDGTANYLPVLAATVSYVAVAGLVAVAALDYKVRR